MLKPFTYQVFHFLVIGKIIPETPSVSPIREHIEGGRNMMFVQSCIIKDRVQRRNGLIVITQQQQCFRRLIVHLFLQRVAVNQCLIVYIIPSRFFLEPPCVFILSKLITG